MNRRFCFFYVVVALGVLAMVWIPVAQAGYTIVDGNSSAVLNAAATASKPAGMVNWTIDGVDHLFQQWFWYRVGDTGDETEIDSLSFLGAAKTSADGDAIDDSLTLNYGSGLFDLSVAYTLTGGSVGSGISHIRETILVTNKTPDPLDFQLFQYTNFDLLDTPDDDFVTVFPYGSPDIFYHVDVGTGMGISEVVSVPTPSYYQAALAGTIPALFNDGLPTTLDNTTSAGDLVTGSDVEFAWQWNATIPVGNVPFSVFKNKRTTFSIHAASMAAIPEPSSFLLLSASLVGIAALVRRKQRNQNT